MSKNDNGKSKTKWKKRLIVGVIVAVVCLLSLRLFGSNEQAVLVTESPTRTTITETLLTSGNIRIPNQIEVFSTTTGIVTGVFVKNGEDVSEGTALFAVQSDASEAEQAAAYTQYANTLSSVSLAESNQKNLQAALEKSNVTLLEARNGVDFKNNNTVNPKTGADYTSLEMQAIDATLVQAELAYEASKKQLDTSQVSIDAAKAARNSAWLAYSATQSTTINAGISGTVGNLTVTVGQQVTASSSGGTGTTTSSSTNDVPALYIGKVSEPQVLITFNESEVAQVAVGQEAIIQIDAIRDKEFTGKVLSIDTFGQNDQGVVTFNVYVSVNSPAENILSEMNATVAINTAKKENVLSVPNSAIKPYEGGKGVEVIDQEVSNGNVQVTKMVMVKVGIKDTNRTEIIEGLVETDLVVTDTKIESGRQSSGGFGPFGR